MENEKVIEKVTEAAVTEVVEKEERAEGNGVTLPLSRRAYTVQGKTYHSYFVLLKVKGVSMELELRPKEGDVNAFRFLDLIFKDVKEQTGKDECDLTCQLVSSKGNDGKRMSYMSYAVERVVDGLPCIAALKPYGDSNKRMLETLYRQKLEALN